MIMKKSIAFLLFGILFFSALNYTAQAVEKKYTWKFQEKEYSLTLQVSEARYNEYSKLHNPTNIKTMNGYYEDIITPLPGDNMMKIVVAQLLTKAGISGINRLDDQANFIMSFIQSAITPDINKVKQLEAKQTPKIKTPFETLYTGTGVCIEKCLLTIAILRTAGYWGSCLFYYPDTPALALHAAVGISCPTIYSLYNSGYCYAETMLPLPIGAMPAISTKSGWLMAADKSHVNGCDNRFGKVFIFLLTTGTKMFMSPQ
jgi:hypothetical protein